MNDLTVKNIKFDKKPHLTKPIRLDEVPDKSYVDIFDQSGYALCHLEKLYCARNGVQVSHHRDDQQAIRKVWFESPKEKISGAVLNHAVLFERKGYSGKAAEQLKEWAQINSLLYKVLNIKPKWGLDFSIDFTDQSGRAFEILHFEYDGFDYNEIQQKVNFYTKVFKEIDWDEKAEEVWESRKEWGNLSFEEASAWKCDFFGIEHERFKQVLWRI